MGLSGKNLVAALLSIHFFLYLNLATLTIGGTNGTDRQALLEFKDKIMEDPLGIMSSWNDTIHFCQWHGVKCSQRHRRVTALDLSSLKLSGTISPYIGNLSFLRELYLQNNSFTHEIPPQMGQLHRLKVLYLHNNSIGGEIPANISGCSNLVSLVIVNNKLVGQIPKELGHLLKLQVLAIDTNNLTGSIPSSLGNLSSLQQLYATENKLVGRIPYALGRLMNLTILALGENMLIGEIPPSIFNLSSILELDLGFNQFQGNLPSELGNSFPKIKFLSVANNSFSGSIPLSLSNASNLENFILGINNFTGQVPSLENLQNLYRLHIGWNHLGSGKLDDLNFLCTLANATRLVFLDIGINNFGGAFPQCICNFSTSLEQLSMNANQISGSIPPEIENLVSLKLLQLSNNRFSGTIPQSISKLQNLEIVILEGNNFFGRIPSSLGNLTKLMYLHLGGNKLNGSIPVSLGGCQRLLELSFSNANLVGVIPTQLISILSLQTLDLSANSLNGSLPIDVGKLHNLGSLDVSHNLLSGEIPNSLASCTSVEVLLMQDNIFEGSIPLSLSKGLTELDLSHNNLSGEVPQYLQDLKFLEKLNLSYNNFEGALPVKGVFGNASRTFVAGNSKLCGGEPQFQLPICKPEHSKRTISLKSKILISTVCSLLGVTMVLTSIFLYWSRIKGKEPATISSMNQLLEVSYQRLLIATNRFSTENLIGQGSFGSVYRGILSEGELIVAIKVLDLAHQGASKSFLAECEALRNIRHRNLVKVLTACSGIDHKGNDFKALVYEFMVNGNLDEWLHPLGRTSQVNDSPRNLNLLQRLNIAIDVASALEYLHHGCEIPIVHCDLKPSNVLLDEDMVGHVGDFGLVKFLSKASQGSVPSNSSSMGVRGTIGYVPPEYGMGNEVSTSGDVYSYGMILLEMFTGKRPTDNIFNSGSNLQITVKDALAEPEGMETILDPALEQDRQIGVAINSRKTLMECMLSIFEIGIACSAELPGDRKSIADVVAQLSSIRERLLAENRREIRRAV